MPTEPDVPIIFAVLGEGLRSWSVAEAVLAYICLFLIHVQHVVARRRRVRYLRGVDVVLAHTIPNTYTYPSPPYFHHTRSVQSPPPASMAHFCTCGKGSRKFIGTYGFLAEADNLCNKSEKCAVFVLLLTAGEMDRLTRTPCVLLHIVVL